MNSSSANPDEPLHADHQTPNAERQTLNEEQYDVVIIGGSLSGAATAILLLRDNPGLNLLIVENRPISRGG